MAQDILASHTAIELLAIGHEVVIIDNLSNSQRHIADIVTDMAGKDVAFYTADVRDVAALIAIFKEEEPDAVIHFAALKAVGESVIKPLEYYDNNVDGTVALLRVVRYYNVRKFVFSSSATVYGSAPYLY